MTITPELFGAYLKCPTKCFLRAHGEPPTGNPYAEYHERNFVPAADPACTRSFILSASVSTYSGKSRQNLGPSNEIGPFEPCASIAFQSAAHR